MIAGLFVVIGKNRFDAETIKNGLIGVSCRRKNILPILCRFTAISEHILVNLDVSVANTD